jgi:nucleotide-binding universal stress UspA family protein
MVILGGDRRPERAEAIQQTFALAEVDWIECREDSPRPVQTLVERIRNQTVDLVVVLQRYVTHSHSDAVFAAEQGSCRVLMAHSYGLQNVMHGLERFLGAGE